MSITDYKTNRKWSDRFNPRIQEICSRNIILPVNIIIAPYEDDALRNTDLFAMSAGDKRIACRMRRPEYLKNYANEFTITCKIPGMPKVELDKLLEGWGDFFFYGFSNQDEKDIARWFIGDLHAFRGYYYRKKKELPKGIPPGSYRKKPDGSGDFLSFKLRQMPDNFIIACSWQKEKQQKRQLTIEF